MRHFKVTLLAAALMLSPLAAAKHPAVDKDEHGRISIGYSDSRTQAFEYRYGPHQNRYDLPYAVRYGVGCDDGKHCRWGEWQESTKLQVPKDNPDTAKCDMYTTFGDDAPVDTGGAASDGGKADTQQKMQSDKPQGKCGDTWYDLSITVVGQTDSVVAWPVYPTYPYYGDTGGGGSGPSYSELYRQVQINACITERSGQCDTASQWATWMCYLFAAGGPWGVVAGGACLVAVNAGNDQCKADAIAACNAAF